MQEGEEEIAEGNDQGAGDAALQRMNKAQLIAHLEAQGVELAGGETKAELLALIAE